MEIARASYLIVEDNAGVARAIARLLSPFGDATVVGSVRDAERVLSDHRPWDAFFIDVGLPDGSGLDLLARARATHPTTPALVVTGMVDAGAINGAYDLHASFVAKPIRPGRIEQFLRATASFRARVGRATESWSMQYGLSEAEVDVLVMAVMGDGREAIAHARGTSELTVKKHVANLLKKTEDASLEIAVARLLREVGDRRDSTTP